MSSVAILGAGPIGAATAQALAGRQAVRAIRLLDADANVAAGKALDLLQTTPIDGVDVSLSGSGDLLSSTGADVIVIADRVSGGEWQGEEGLALVRQLVRSGTMAPLVFAGASQVKLMETAHAELHVPADRLIGTATSALVAIARALVSAEIGMTGVEVMVAGRPPAFVVGWSAATVGGTLLTERVPAHRLLALSTSLRRFWPPGPQTIGATTAQAVAALVDGSRSLVPATAILDGELGARRVAAMLPLELGRGRVLRRVVPSLSPQERTEVVTGLGSGVPGVPGFRGSGS
jgi:malate dehydrogenase